MNYKSNRAAIEDLALSEGGVFTTAQAIRLHIPRDALSYAARAGRIERIEHGAYRLAASEDDGLDELRAYWKLTVPSAFTHERSAREEWDGIAVCGPTAAHILEIGDFYAAPYHIAAPRRINSRKKDVRFVRLDIPREDVIWRAGLPVTRPEATLAFLARGFEDPSLVADAFVDAVRRHGSTSFDINKLKRLLGDGPYARLIEDAGITSGGESRKLVDLDEFGHVAIADRVAQ